MGRPASKVTRVLVTGPLAPFAPMLKARLRERGYTPLSTVIVMRLVAHLSRWLDANALGVSDLAGEQVERYIAARRGEGRTSALSPHSVDSILAMLADAGALVPETVAVPATGQEALLSDFRRHLLGERALTPSTAAAYVAYARRFLAGFAGEGLAGLTAADVTRAVTAEAQAVSASSAQYFVAALRAFLRFCFLEGLLGADLAGAALAVTGRRRSPLPKGISRASAQALLASCDRRRLAGRRAHGARQGPPRRAPAAARRRGPGDRRLSHPRAAGHRQPRGVRARGGAGGAAEPRRNLIHRSPRLPPGRRPAGRRAPAAAHRRLPDGRSGRAADRDRPAAAPQEPGINCELRPGQRDRAAETGSALAVRR